MNVSPMTMSGAKRGRLDLLAVSFVINLLALALPLALLQVYDRILPSQAYGTAVVLVLGVALAIVLESLLRYGRAALFAYLGERFEVTLSQRVFGRLLQADIAAVEQHGSARLVDDFRAISQVRELWSGSTAAGLYEIPFVFVYVALVAYIGGWLALVPVSLFLLALLSTLMVKRQTEAALAAVEIHDHRRRHLLWGIFSGLAGVKARGAEPGLAREYAGLNATYMQAGLRLESLNAWVRENASLLAQLSTVLIVLLGAHSVMDGSLTTGALSACTLLAGRSIGPAMMALGYLPRLAQARVGQAKVQSLLDLPLAPASRDVVAGRADPTVMPPQAALMLSRGAQSWTVAPGEIVQVTAGDSARTSDWLAWLAGMTAPEAARGGSAQLGECSLHGDSRWRQQVLLVPRQPALVPGSVLDNLTFFDARYQEAAHVAAEAIGLTALLGSQRYGLLSPVGLPGADWLDEGVAQRIALVRALIRQPAVLLLDHAGSGLDLDGQQRLAGLLAARGDMMVLMASAKAPLQALARRRLDVQEAAP